MGGVNTYKDKVVDRLYKGLVSTILSRKIEIIQGDGRLVSPTAVSGSPTPSAAPTCPPFPRWAT